MKVCFKMEKYYIFVVRKLFKFQYCICRKR